MHFDCQVPNRPYYDAAVLAKVRYKDVIGGFWAFAFTSTDQVVSGTREIWGYNMKLADMSIVEHPDRIEARCLRLGKTIISLNVNPNNQTFEAEDMYMYPRIFLKGIPDANHIGGCRHEVITMNCRPDEVRTHTYGAGKVSFERSEEDPLHTLDIVKVFGATFTTGHQTLPWGQTLT
jgi:acetoacetate decarboxylase